MAVRYWRDQYGRRWRVPKIKDRLRPHQIKGHGALRDYIIWRDMCCKHCQATKNLIADHIRSKRNGGSHHPKNLQALCVSCNSAKANSVDRKGKRKATNEVSADHERRRRSARRGDQGGTGEPDAEREGAATPTDGDIA